MKTGDPKQAAILGVVAIGTLGFLGSSLFSSFAGGSTPVPVANSQSSAQPAESTPGSGATSPEKLPDREPLDIGDEAEDNGFPAKIEKTPFGKPTVKQPGAVTNSKGLQKTGRQSEFGSKGEQDTAPLDPTSGDQASLPVIDGMTPGGGGDVASNKPKPIMIRFEGYVDAGNPVAIIRIGESQFTADQGEGLPYGIRVLAITSEKLTLSIRGRQKSVWIGREVQL
ncbi:MAG: hypothetical protein QE269_07240 [Fimbriimonas sp.]|nr:hypothetical protein [Fimbriimonas sp.]